MSVVEHVSRSGSRSRTGWVLLVVGLVVFVYVIASLAWPQVVPRVGLLPKPAVTTWYDGCNWHGRTFERSGPFWTPTEDMTTRACPEGGLPEDDR